MIGGFIDPLALHIGNLLVFLSSVVLAASDNTNAAIVAGIFSVTNTFLILRSQREHKKAREDLNKRRLVVVKYGDGDEETVVITPEERRALGEIRERDHRHGH